MKKMKTLAVLATAMLAFAFVSCSQVSNSSSNATKNFGSYPTLNEAEKEVAGKTFSGNGKSYTFNEDKTGFASDSSSARAVRAVVSGNFDWSATKNGDNVNITMTQGGSSSNATFDAKSGELSVNNEKFSDSTDRIVAEMNLVRKNPGLYAQTYLEPRLSNFNGNLYRVDKTTQEATKEGATAVREAINALKNTSALQPLSVEKGLRLAAQLHANDLKTNNMKGHTGKDGSNPATRMAKYGTGGTTSGDGGENINYGRYDPREIVIQLLVDDGTANRAHRMNILNPAFSQAGSFTTTHPDTNMPYVSVINFNSGYKTTDTTTTLEESMSDKAPQTSGDVAPTAGVVTPANLKGTSWIEEKSNAPSSMYMALYFISENSVGIGACNSKVLALDYAKSSPGGAGHHYDTAYNYTNGSGSITLPQGASPHYGGNITVNGDILTLTNGSAGTTIVFRKLADASTESLANTKWVITQAKNNNNNVLFSVDYPWLMIDFIDGNKVKIGTWNGEAFAKNSLTGSSNPQGLAEGVWSTTSYTYGGGSGNISVGTSWEKFGDASAEQENFAKNALKGTFTVNVEEGTLTINGYVLSKM